MAFIGFSMNAKLASHIKAYFALAPVARYGHAVGLMRYIAYAKPEIKVLFLPQDANFHSFLGLFQIVWNSRLFAE